MSKNIYVIHNDDDLRVGIKKWYSLFKDDDKDTVSFEFQIENNSKIERFSANGFNNLLIAICALKEKHPNICIYVHLISNDLLNKVFTENQYTTIKNGVKRLLIFLQSLNLIEMLLKLGVILRPSDEVLKNIIIKLDAKKEELSHIYSSKILCLNPLINDSQEQYNLTYRMRTLMNILYWQLRDKLDLKEIEEASGQIMFELVKNIYQHSGIKNNLNINGFTCAQINSSPIIQYADEVREKRYTGTLFLALSQRNKSYKLSHHFQGAFISITVNDFGVGIHNKVKEKNGSLNTPDAIIHAFTTSFSTKMFDKEEVWNLAPQCKDIKLEHKGFGLLYCLLFVFKNYGRIQICSGDVEIRLFTKLECFRRNYSDYNTPIEFLNLINSDENGYLSIFDIEKTPIENFVGTQILIEIPTDCIYPYRG